MHYKTKSLNTRCSFLSVRTDGVVAKRRFVNSIGVVRRKTNFPVCTHIHMNEAAALAKFFVNLGLWRWRRLQAARGERHSLQISTYNLFTGRRNQEEIFASQILPLSSRQSHPNWLLAFHIWIEWSATKTRRALGTDGAQTEKRHWKMEPEDANRKTPPTEYLKTNAEPRLCVRSWKNATRTSSGSWHVSPWANYCAPENS